jgi:hypothetical protein
VFSTTEKNNFLNATALLLVLLAILYFTMQEAVKSVDTGQWPAGKEYVPYEDLCVPSCSIKTLKPIFELFSYPSL